MVVTNHANNRNINTQNNNSAETSNEASSDETLMESTSLLLIESLAKFYTFDEVVQLLCHINFNPSSKNEAEHYYLPKDIVIDRIIRSYLCVPNVVHENVIDNVIFSASWSTCPLG